MKIRLFAKRYDTGMGVHTYGLELIDSKTFVKVVGGELLPLREGMWIICEGKNWTLASPIEVHNNTDFKSKFTIIEPLSDIHADKDSYPPYGGDRFIVERVEMKRVVSKGAGKVIEFTDENVGQFREGDFGSEVIEFSKKEIKSILDGSKCLALEINGGEYTAFVIVKDK